MVFRLELRRHGDLLGTVKATHATGAAGEQYLDYRIAVRNVGTDVVPGNLTVALPSGIALVSAVPTQGRCGPMHPGGRVRCVLGPIQTGFDRGAAVTIRALYDCATFEPIGPSAIVVSSHAGDLDPSNNREYLDELDRDCPDPFDTWFEDPEPPPEDPEPPPEPVPPPQEPVPPPQDPVPPPEDPVPPPQEPVPPLEDPVSPPPADPQPPPEGS